MAAAFKLRNGQKSYLQTRWVQEAQLMVKVTMIVVGLCLMGAGFLMASLVIGKPQKTIVLKAFHNGKCLLVVRGLDGAYPRYPAEGSPIIGQIYGIDKITVEEEK